MPRAAKSKSRTKPRAATRKLRAVAPPRPALAAFIADLGALRITLALSAIALVFLVPDPTIRSANHTVATANMVIAALAPLVLMLLLLDALMSTVFLQDKQGAVRVQLRRTVAMHLVLAAALVVAWYPFFRVVATRG